VQPAIGRIHNVFTPLQVNVDLMGTVTMKDGDVFGVDRLLGEPLRSEDGNCVELCNF
jgi:hypothetical protein